MKRGATFALLVVVVGCSSNNGNVDAGSPDPDAQDNPDRRSVTTDGGPVCGPVDTSTYAPASYSPPSGRHQNKCSTQQMTDYVACITNADTTKCAQFTGAGASVPCSSCIESLSTDKAWGPLVSKDGGKTLDFNIPGCLDLVLGPGGCGKALDASYGCQEAACRMCNDTSSPTKPDCVGAALTASCKPYDDQFKTSCALDAANPDLAPCSPDDSITDPAQQQADFLMRIGLYFCGQ
jgi:hypothetical protein